MATTNNFTFGVDAHPFTLNFPFIDEDNLVVTLDGVVKTLDTDYTVINKTDNTAAGVGFLSGAQIQFNAPIPTSGAVKVVRNTTLETAATFKTGSAIRAIDLNSNFTQNLYVTEEISNNAILTDGSNAFDGDLNMGGNQITNLGTPATDSDAVTKLYVDSRLGSTVIPGYTRWRTTATASQTVFSGVGEAGGTLAYSATRENVYVNGALQQRTVDYTADNGTSVTFTVGLQAGDIVDIVCVNNLNGSTSDQSSDVYFLQDGTGATTRTVESKLRDVVSVKDFGAKGNGTDDDTAAIQAAIDYAKVFYISSTQSFTVRNDKNCSIVYIPAGTYKVTAPLIINGPGVHIKGAGTAATVIDNYGDSDCFYARADLQTTTDSLENIAFSDMSIRGRFVDPTQGAGIRVGIARHVYVDNIKFNGLFDDILFQGTKEPVFVSNCNFFSNNGITTARVGNAHIKATPLVIDAAATSTNAKAGPDGSGNYYAYCSSIMVSNCEMRTAAGYKEFAILVNACDGFYVQNCHILNHKEQIRVSRTTSVAPCSNVRLENCFFDGESPNTQRNVYVVSTQPQVGGKAVTDVSIYNCKFNGVGDTSTGVEAWLISEDIAIKYLLIQGCYFDKALNETAAAIELKKGYGTCNISDNIFLMETGTVPTVLIRSNSSNVVASEIFENIIIDSNKLICQGTVDRPDYNIRLANAQNNVIISNNCYYGDTGVGGDNLLYDTKTSGTTYGSGTTLNNVEIV